MLKRSKSIFHQPVIDYTLYEVYDKLYLSSGSASRDLENLKSHNITHVINVAGTTEFCCFRDKLEYLAINLLDSDSEDIECVFPITNSFIKSAHESGGSVLVHCHEGISRAPTICAAFIMVNIHIDSEKALEIIGSVKSNVNPNQNFRNQLDLYYFNHIKKITDEDYIELPQLKDTWKQEELRQDQLDFINRGYCEYEPTELQIY